MVSGTEAKIIVCRGIWDPRTCEKENTDIALNWKSYFSDAGGYSFENTSYMYVEMCLLFLPAAKNTWQEPSVTLGCLRESKKFNKICQNCTFIRRKISTITPTNNNTPVVNIMAPTGTLWWTTWVALIKPLKQEKLESPTACIIILLSYYHRCIQPTWLNMLSHLELSMRW